MKLIIQNAISSTKFFFSEFQFTLPFFTSFGEKLMADTAIVIEDPPNKEHVFQCQIAAIFQHQRNLRSILSQSFIQLMFY